MKRPFIVFLAAATLIIIASIVFAQTKTHRLSQAVLKDKIRGGWAGQMIGVSFGAPTEFKHNGKIIEGELKWTPERISNSIDQDDLYVEMTFTKVLDDIGLNATTEQFGEAFKDSKYMLWHANAGARRNLNRGIKAPWSGHPKYNFHANDIDFQIEADFIGMMTPGLPQEANKYADRVGRVMNFGDGLYGGMFVSGMYAAAFFESDPRKVVEAGLKSIPANSGYGKLVSDLLAWHNQYPDDWKKAWQLLKDKWDKDDPCPEGVLKDFNIDARLNGGHIVLGLLWGNGDFDKTIDISTRAGQDSDCNPSSAIGVLGVMVGYDKIPDNWKSGIAAIADKKFQFTDYSFNTIVDSTIRRAHKVITSVGGKVTDSEIVVPVQLPKAPKLEQWNPGIPEKFVQFNDPAWQWKGNWRDDMPPKDNKPRGKAASGAGAEAVLTFAGKAICVFGPMSQDGGRADVFLDGKKMDFIDAYVVERTFDYDLWRAYDLKPGQHTLRIVTREDADARSKGKKVVLQRAIIYR
ncbi:MAG: ADP-ribosylglycohydrolase family protein [Acidobacteria bacterium]|nr:ADP-ribosylglycohydrolase family protein [Acidobacteriota bacterium]